MRKITGWAMIACAVAVLVAVAIAMTMRNADAGTLHRVRATPAVRTCKAFARWDGYPSAANLNALMSDSIRAPWHPLGVDVVVLFTDVRDGDRYDLPADVKAIAADCHMAVRN